MLFRFFEPLKLMDGWQIARAVLDVAVVSYVIYRLILLAKGRRAWWILIGLGVFFLLQLISEAAGLLALNWILKQVTPIAPIAIVVLFYPELRELLEKVGRAEFWGAALHVTHHEDIVEIIEEVVRTAGILSPLKTGALMVMERETGLDDIVATGTALDAEVTSELLGTLFYNGTPLHDGAVIIRQGRIAAAGCTLPLSDSPNIAANVHMRHRAAIGLSESADAVIVVVSEETGTISLAVDGKLQRGLKPDALRQKLLEAFGRTPKPKKASRLSLRRRDKSAPKSEPATLAAGGANTSGTNNSGVNASGTNALGVSRSGGSDESAAT